MPHMVARGGHETTVRRGLGLDRRELGIDSNRRGSMPGALIIGLVLAPSLVAPLLTCPVPCVQDKPRIPIEGGEAGSG
jgi:hypothetical protein